jgi:hypothetical protein
MTVPQSDWVFHSCGDFDQAVLRFSFEMEHGIADVRLTRCLPSSAVVGSEHDSRQSILVAQEKDAVLSLAGRRRDADARAQILFRALVWAQEKAQGEANAVWELVGLSWNQN